jgi:hypothetical protein
MLARSLNQRQPGLEWRLSAKAARLVVLLGSLVLVSVAVNAIIILADSGRF